MATKKHPTQNGSARDATSTTNCRWLARLGMYHRKRALTFQSEQELKKAIDALWEPTGELYRMPRAPAGALTMIVPEEAVPLFRAQQLSFVEHPVTPATRGAPRAIEPNVA